MTPIGASEAAICCNLQQRRRDGTPYTSQLELWAKCRGLLPRYDAASSADADAGRLMEAGIGLRYAELHSLRPGADIAPGPQIPTPGLSHPDLPFLAVRPDFLVPGRERVLEVKAPRELDPELWGEPGSDHVPPWYAVQVIAQVAVAVRLTGWEAGDLVAAARAARGSERAWAEYTIVRDERREALLLQRVRDFWRRHVEDGVPPVGDGSESASTTLARIFRPNDTTVQATAEDVERWHRLLSVRSALDELEAQRRELEQALQARMGSATVLEHGGRRLATWRAKSGASRIDIHRLRRERPDIVRDFAEQGAAGRSFNIEREPR